MQSSQKFEGDQRHLTLIGDDRTPARDQILQR